MIVTRFMVLVWILIKYIYCVKESCLIVEIQHLCQKVAGSNLDNGLLLCANELNSSINFIRMTCLEEQFNISKQKIGKR